jgi:hypothetical protein
MRMISTHQPIKEKMQLYFLINKTASSKSKNNKSS